MKVTKNKTRRQDKTDQYTSTPTKQALKSDGVEEKEQSS
jgi:hypothetical protein